VTDRDITRIVARGTAAALAVAAVGFGLWQVRSIATLLLLALTFAAAIRPGVDWLHRHRVPEPGAIFVFFVIGLGTIGIFCWLAVPPALHQIAHAVDQSRRSSPHAGGALEQRALNWLDANLRRLPTGTDLIHPVASYGHKATNVVVAVFFTLAATWYWVSERDPMIRLLTSLSPKEKRAKARQTYIAIDDRLGAYTRLRFAMVFAVGAVLSLGFYLVGLDYWLLVGGFVGIVEIVPVVGPLIGALLVLAVGLPESVHVAVLALLVLIGVRTFQSYVINPHVMGHSVGLSPLVTLVSVAVVGALFGGFAVILAVPFTSAVATLVDVLVLGHDLPTAPAPRPARRFGRQSVAPADAA
jgi:predicted PurR-regulated permease PerM